MDRGRGQRILRINMTSAAGLCALAVGFCLSASIAQAQSYIYQPPENLQQRQDLAQQQTPLPESSNPVPIPLGIERTKRKIENQTLDEIFEEEVQKKLDRTNQQLKEREPTLTVEEREERLKQQGIDPSLTAEEREAAKSANENAQQPNQAQSPEEPEEANDTAQETEPDTAFEAEQNPVQDLAEEERLSPEQAAEVARRLRQRQPTQDEESFTPYPTGTSWNTLHGGEADPYGALGKKVGSFYIYPEFVLEGAHTDNVFLDSSGRKNDSFIELRPSLEVESDWNRHALAGAVRGTFNSYDDYDSEREASVTAEIRGRIDVSMRTNLELDASYNHAQEGRGSLDLPGAAAERTDVDSSVAGATLNHRFNRLALAIRGSIGEVNYEDTRLVGGGTEDNDDREYNEYAGSLRLTYDFKPGFAIFSEGQIGKRDYKQRVDNDGFERSSDRYTVKAGLLVDIGPKLRGELGLGHAWQNPDDVNLVDIRGFVMDAMLQWRPREYTTVTFNARSDIEETTFGSAAGILERYFAAEIQHSLRRNFILTAGINYLTEDYRGSSTEQNTLGLTAGAEYLLSRRTAILGSFNHTKADGSADAQTYRENEVRLGVRLRP